MSSSDIVQLISLPLEIIGLFLTITQVFFKGYDSQLEVWFSKKLTDFTTWLIKNDKWSFRIFMFYIIGLMLIPPFTITVLRSLVEFGYLEESWFNESYFEEFVWFHIGVMIILIILSVFQHLQRLLPKKNLLAFGIWLTILGVMGEVYQVYKIFW